MFSSRGRSKESSKGISKGKPKSKSNGKSKGKSKDKSKGKSKDPEDETRFLDLYLAVKRPLQGNFYHWGFVVRDKEREWHFFQVVQDVMDGPYRREFLRENPEDSQRCLRPLTSSGQLHPDWWDQLVQGLGRVLVPGEGESWNCQDYVMDIWDMLYDAQMISHDVWVMGKANMMPFYGADVCWDAEVEGGDGGDVHEEEPRDSRQFRSAQFVYDSSSTGDEAGPSVH